MKKLYITAMVCLSAQFSSAQIFSQDFSTVLTAFQNSASTDATYVNTTAPTSSQFTQLQSNSNGTVIEVVGTGGNANTLRIARTSGTGNFARNGAAGSLGSPGTMIFKMDINVIGFTSTSNTGVTVQVGDGFSDAVTATEATSLVHSSFALRLDQTATGAYKLRNAAGTNSSTSHTGALSIFFVINNSGSSVNYTGPDNNTYSLANDTYDLWGGTTREFSAQAATTGTQALNNFKVTQIQGNITYDNINISQIPTQPVPIRLEYFKGRKSTSGNALNWKLNSTSASIVMDIERSADGNSFQRIGSITADQARCAQPFDFADAAPMSATNYYRLKMTDINGKISYSPIVTISNSIKGTSLSSLYPTLIRNEATLEVNAEKNTSIQVVITDINGKVFRKKQYDIGEGNTTLSIDCSQLPSGNYQLSGYENGVLNRTIRFVRL